LPVEKTAPLPVDKPAPLPVDKPAPLPVENRPAHKDLASHPSPSLSADPKVLEPVGAPASEIDDTPVVSVLQQRRKRIRWVVACVLAVVVVIGAFATKAFRNKPSAFPPSEASSAFSVRTGLGADTQAPVAPSALEPPPPAASVVSALSSPSASAPSQGGRRSSAWTGRPYPREGRVEGAPGASASAASSAAISTPGASSASAAESPSAPTSGSTAPPSRTTPSPSSPTYDYEP
jgi:hypothetical protein